MKARVLQTDISWGDASGNIERVRKMLEPGADLYLLPEMWSSGFTMEPEKYAEPSPGKALSFMKESAARLDAAVAGSVAVREDGKYRNRFYFVKPDGSTIYYDKHHLFTYSGEDRHYAAGENRVTVEWRGVRFRLTVCYDLRFPAWCRNRGDYDVMLCVASWPEPRIEAWRTLLKARAIENQCYVVACNRVGDDPSCHYVGGSAIIDAYGNSLTQETDKEYIFEQEIDLENLMEFRRKFPVLSDSDFI